MAHEFSSGDGDSGILKGFWPRNPYVEARDLARTFPHEVLQGSANEEMMEYYGFDHVPTETEVYLYDRVDHDEHGFRG